jgi:hypothetical protein
MVSTAEAVNERLRGLGNWVPKVHFSECFVVAIGSDAAHYFQPCTRHLANSVKVGNIDDGFRHIQDAMIRGSARTAAVIVQLWEGRVIIGASSNQHRKKMSNLHNNFHSFVIDT